MCLDSIRILIFSLILLVGLTVVAAADEQPQQKPGVTRALVYKQQPRRTLTVYFPDDWKVADRRPTLVIFRCNIPFQREYFRQLGMVVVKPQLAPVNSGQLPKLSLPEIAKLSKPRHQVEDAKSVIRYLRSSAPGLGIDPDRIVATGTSGGGDLALQTVINTAFADSQDDNSVSHQPNSLVLFCPAFDGIDIWFVRMATLLERTRTDAPDFLPLLPRFVRNTTDEYATPLDHRSLLIRRAATLGKEQNLGEEQIARFQTVLELFNARDWQLLHPWQDALMMSATRILPQEPLPPTLIMYGDRDHLLQYQTRFVEKARAAGQKFDLKIFEGGGHSFMTQPAFEQSSSAVVESFLRREQMLTPRSK